MAGLSHIRWIFLLMRHIIHLCLRICSRYMMQTDHIVHVFQVVLQPIEEIKEVHNCLMTHMTRYNEEFGNIQLNLMLSEHVISHVIRLHRVLSFQHG